MKRLKNKVHFIILLFFSTLLISNCAHYPLNKPLKTVQQTTPYALENFNQPPGADETFVVLTFSGGGTRAAALSYGVLEKMSTIILPGTNRSLLEELDIISTVSGGSFTGAYYALFRERIFRDFKDKFLYRNIEKELTKRLINPYNLFRLISPYFSRIDMASELYDETIFGSETFQTIAETQSRPFLIINATNLYQGARFEFTRDQFQYIGSDILSYPVARAVAASSAFPFLLSPISLKNYPYPSDYNIPVRDQLCLEDYWYNRRCYYRAYNNNIYTDKENHPYLHLIDGGLADNLGLRAIHDLYLRSEIRKKVNNGSIKRFLVIVVNAKNEKPETLDTKESPPGLISVGHKTCTISMDNFTFETVEMFKELVAERQKAQRYIYECQELLDTYSSGDFRIPPLAGGDLKLFVVDLSFDNLSDKEQREFFKNLPTSFSLNKTQVDSLIKVGGQLLDEDPEFRLFMDELD